MHVDLYVWHDRQPESSDVDARQRDLDAVSGVRGVGRRLWLKGRALRKLFAAVARRRSNGRHSHADGRCCQAHWQLRRALCSAR